MLLRRIEQFIKERRMSRARFGREAVGDPNFVFDLRDGRELRERTVARVSTYLDRAEQETRPWAA
jgi:2,4-dienoyl-CoA reductase-like NADH-dependent reductase (Old Yellow Enzyme family)